MPISYTMGGVPPPALLKKKGAQFFFGGQFFFRAFGLKISGVQKFPKKVVFGLKNVKIFESNIQFFFVKKKSH